MSSTAVCACAWTGKADPAGFAAPQTRTLSRLSSKAPEGTAGADSDDEDNEVRQRVQPHSLMQQTAGARLSILSRAGAASRRQSTLSTASAGARPAPGAGRAADADSEDEQWARTSAAASTAPSLFRPTAAPSALLQRRLSAVSTASLWTSTPPARGDPKGGSDSEDEAWAKAKVARRASIVAPTAAAPASRAASLRLQAPLARRASVVAAPAPDQAAERSEDSDEERWQRLKSRAHAGGSAQGMPCLRRLQLPCSCPQCMRADRTRHAACQCTQQPAGE